MKKKFEVQYAIRGTVSVLAKNEEEAKNMVLNSDYVNTEELLEGSKMEIGEMGNDAVSILDVFES